MPSRSVWLQTMMSPGRIVNDSYSCELSKEIMTYNIYSMEMNDNIVRGMNDFVDFLYSLDRIKQKSPAEQVFYTKILEDVANGR